jgi:hypothetical protein
MSETENVEQTTTDTDTTDRASDPDTAADRHNSERQERGESVRETLRQSWRDATGEDPLPDEGREERRKRDERKTKREWGPSNRAARASKEASDADAQRQADASDNKATDAAAQSRPVAIGPDGPTAWNKDARAEWQRLPKSVQDAVAKREQDVQKGVESLRSRYEREDREWAKHEPTIRHFGMNRAQSLERLFSWHDSLMRNPTASYPALARAQGHDPKMIVASVIAHNPDHFPQDVVNGALQGLGLRPQQQQYSQQQAQQRAGGGQIDPQLYQYLQSVESRLGGIQQNHQEQLQAQTQQVLDNWSKDKEFFSEVRYLMGSLAMPNPETGQSVVPLKDGAVDLDGLYAAACAMTPAISEKQFQQKLAAERKAASDAAARARRTGVSFGPSSPGRNTGSSSSNKSTRGKSVRESLHEAIQASRGNERY